MTKWFRTVLIVVLLLIGLGVIMYKHLGGEGMLLIAIGIILGIVMWD